MPFRVGQVWELQRRLHLGEPATVPWITLLVLSVGESHCMGLTLESSAEAIWPVGSVERWHTLAFDDPPARMTAEAIA